MMRRRGRIVLVLAALSCVLAVAGAPSALALAPRPDNPNGARISLSGTSFTPGATVSFTGTGWTTTASQEHGAVLGGVKLDDTDQLNTETVTADAAGKLSGSVSLPAGIAPGEHWLRFLSGSDQPGDPVRSLHASFRVVAAAPSGTGASTTAATSASAPVSAPSVTASSSTRTVAAGAGNGGSAGGTLPKTGMDISTTVWISGALLAVAMVLAGADVLRRRRRTLEE